jgi:autotransporter-associated beta strand protein
VIFSNNTSTSVSLGSTRTVTNVDFQTGWAGAFTLSGGSLAIQNGGGVTVYANVVNSQTVNSNIAIAGNAAATNNSLTSGVNLNIGGAITSSASSGVSTLTLGGSSGGTVSGSIANGATGGRIALTKSGSGTWTVSGPITYTGDTSVQAGRLFVPHLDSAANTSVSSGAKLTSDYIRQTQLTIGGTVEIRPNGGSSTVSRVSSMSIAGTAGNWTGKLDLAHSDLIINNGNLSTVVNQVVTAMNSPLGLWQGNGITSSAAAANPNVTTLGVVSNTLIPGPGPIYTQFDGQSLTGNEVLVKFTWQGDADLNGTVDADDLTLWIDGYYLQGSMAVSWISGDFDYNGVVDADDLTLFINGYYGQSGTLSALSTMTGVSPLTLGVSGSMGAVGAFSPSQVPEPATLTLLGAGSILLLLRRARRN